MTDNIIVICSCLVLALYFSLLLFYLALRRQNKSLTKSINEMSPRATKFLAKYDFSKEKVLRKLETDAQRIDRVRRTFRLSILMISIYILLRLLDMLKPMRHANFPNYSDYLMFSLLLITLYAMLLRRLLLQLNNSWRDYFSRLLKD